ncbi:MAG TPA: ATP-binding protein [Bacteroidota bacterium]|nr:ATP-binding protein [Bacteroidota bacterium]
MPEARSLRFVLTLWYSVVLLVALFLFGAAVYIYLQRAQEASLRSDLLEEVDWISRLVDIDRKRIAGGEIEALSDDVERRITDHFLANPRNYIVILESSSGNMLFESGKGEEAHAAAGGIPPGRTAFMTLLDIHGAPVQAAARRDDPFIIQVAYTQGASRAVLGRLLSIFAVLTPVVLFLSVSGGWLMAGIVLRPIRDVSERARNITASNLSGRIPPRAVQDELGELIATINDMIARLEDSFRNIREFSLSIAHELKTPLTILKGESELALAHPLTPGEAQDLASMYLEETSRLSRIVDDLLTLARVESGQMSLAVEPVELHRLLEDIHEDALILASGKQMTVTMDQNDEARLVGDPVRLRQLFRALISNAVRYTDAGGTIRIRSRRLEAEAIVSIEDTGIGIPPESLGKIFERFYRVEEARTRARGGSGLGLALARWIAEAHRGSIDVRSTPGEGSCFTVHLPLAPPA